MTVQHERRRFPRQETSLVMSIVCGSASGTPNDAISILTSNIGPGGALFRTPRWRELPVGARVDFSVFSPGPFGGERWHCFRLSGSGRVIRHQEADGMPESDWVGVAVSFDTPMELR